MTTNGAIIHIIMVPNASAADVKELAMSYSFGWNHWAVILVGNPALTAFGIEFMAIPNYATG